MTHSLVLRVSPFREGLLDLCIIDSLTSNSANGAITHARTKPAERRHFPCRTRPSRPALRDPGQHLGSALVAGSNHQVGTKQYKKTRNK